VCYERSWESHRRNEEATSQIRRLFARYRAEAQRARRHSEDPDEMPGTPAWPVVEKQRDDEREPALR